MNSSPRLKWLLGILAVTAALGFWLRGSSEPIDTKPTKASSTDIEGDAPPPRALVPSAPAAATTTEVIDIETDALDRIPPGYRVGRDPWRFVEPPPPPEPPPYRPPALSAEELRRQREAEEAARLAAEEALRRQQAEDRKPKPPPFPYTCVGRLSQKNRRIFILMSEDGRRVLNVEQGETIEGKFIVARAGLESLEIKFVGFPDWPPTIVPVPVSR